MDELSEAKFAIQDPDGGLWKPRSALERIRVHLLGYDIFISYAHEDRAYAMALEDRLRREDMSCFRDAGELPAAHPLAASISKAIRKSRSMVVILSAAAEQSDWVKKEIAELQSSNKILIPLFIGSHPGEAFLASRWPSVADRIAVIESAGSFAEARPSGKAIRDILYCLKFVRTNLIARCLEGIAVFLLATMAALSAWQAHVAGRERDFAERERFKAEDLIDYMVTDLKSSLEKVGKVRLLKGPASKALEYFRETSGGNETPERMVLHRKAFNNLGDVQLSMGELDQADTSRMSALRLAKALRHAAPEDPLNIARLADSYANVGDIFLRKGNVKAAEDHYRTAVDSAKKAVSVAPGNLAAHRILVSARTRLADLTARTSRLEEAIKGHEANLQDARDLASGQPDNLGLQDDQFVALMKLGAYYETAGNLGMSRACYLSADTLADRLLRSDPRKQEYVKRKELVNDQFGFLCLKENKVPDALAFFKKSLAMARDLEREDPDRVEWKEDQATSFDNSGTAWLQAGKLDSAESAFRSSMEIRRKLVASSPGDIALLRALAVSHHKMGKFLHRAGNHTAAISEFDASQETYRHAVRQNPQDNQSREFLAINAKMISECYSRLGRMDSAWQACKASKSILDSLVRLDDGNTRWKFMHESILAACDSLRNSSSLSQSRQRSFSR